MPDPNPEQPFTPQQAQRSALHFESIHLDRVRGITDPFTLDQLSPTFNLVHGPNGIGKTTTALALQKALWPQHPKLDKPSLNARYKLNQTPWQIELTAGSPEWFDDGHSSSQPPALGPTEHHRHYWLALHDLIINNDADFAQQIAKETFGNIDLDEATNNLNFTPKPRIEQKPDQTYRKSLSDIKHAERTEKELEQQAAQLPELKQQLEAIAQASNEHEQYQKLKTVLEAKANIAEWQVIIDQLPTAMPHLREDDNNLIERLIASKQQQTQKQTDASTEQQRIKTELETINLPPEEQVNEDLLTLDRAYQNLTEYEEQIKNTQRERTQAETEQTACAERLGEIIHSDQLNQLGQPEQQDLSQLARHFAQSRAWHAVHDANINQLQTQLNAIPESELTLDQLQDATRWLAEWLTTPLPPTPTSTDQTQSNRLITAGVISLAVIALALSIALVLMIHLAWLVAPIFIVIIAAYLLWPARPDPSQTTLSADPRETIVTAYNKTSAPSPSTWQPEAVIQTLDSLNQQRVEQQRREHLSQALTTETNHQPPSELDPQTLNTKLDTYKQQLGINVEISTDWLPAFADNLARWQKASDTVGNSQAIIDELTVQHDEQRASLELIFERYQLTSVTDSKHLSQHLEEVKKRHRERGALQNDLKHAETDQTNAIEAIHEIEKELDRLRERLDQNQEITTEEIKETITSWLIDLPDYADKSKQIAAKQAEIKPLIDQLPDELLNDPPATYEIENKLDETQALIAKRESTITEIATIKDRLQQARTKHNLTEALEAKANAESMLIQQRDDLREQVAGAAIIDWLRDSAQTQTRPAVFNRANQLLTQINKGTLTLDLSNDSQTQFVARDTRTDRTRPIQEISTGERIQLLLAVRLAFIEQNETVQLPIILDEILGTTDDERAAAVIEAIISLLQTGRQIFYFTAQQDEASKWLAGLNEHNLKPRIIDLAAARKQSADPLNIPESDALPGNRNIPEPTTNDRFAYAQQLNVPPIDPHAPNINHAHLWHIVTDLPLLHQLLTLGLETCGSLKAYPATPQISSKDEDWTAVLNRRMNALDALHTAYQHGRGRPVTPTDLEACPSEIMTDLAKKRVIEYSQTIQGNAKTLIATIEDHVERWQKRKTEPLRDWLVQGGFIDEATPHDRDTLRGKALAVLANNDLDNISPEDIHWLDETLATLNIA